MSKFSNMLNMLILLKSRGRMTIHEISEELEVDERTIRKYRDDFEMAGIYIKSVHGINGGYELESAEFILDLKLEEDEFAALQLASQQLKEQAFIYNKEFQRLVDKLNIIKVESTTEFDKVEYMSKYVKPKDVNNERKICIDISRAIVSCNKIKIKYFSLSSGIGERIVHPYAVITYKCSLYFVAFCENRKAIRQFKLSRLKAYEILDENFQRVGSFSLEKYMKDSFGIYKDEKIKVKLKIYKPMSYVVSEKIWVENQKIIWLEDESIIFEAEMRGKTEIKSWIMSMGGLAKVLEPKSLVEEIKQEIKSIEKMYLK